MSHSLASTGFSTDSEALGQFVEEQVATDNFVITTETAPNTTHFQGKHLKTSSEAASRLAVAKAKAASADAAGIAAAAEEAATAVAAAAAGITAVPPTILEEDDYEIEFSEDGQAPDSATEAAIAAVLEQQQRQQQQQQRQQQRDWKMTERLPGDLIYEMLPGVDDAAIWATLPDGSLYEQQQQQQQQQRRRQNGSYGGAHSSTGSSTCSSSAFASTRSGSNGSSGATKAWMYGTGGFFAGLAGRATFGSLGTIGSLRSTDFGVTGEVTGGATPVDELMQEMTTAQVCACAGRA
jgi:hypothetical protein